MVKRDVHPEEVNIAVDFLFIQSTQELILKRAKMKLNELCYTT